MERVHALMELMHDTNPVHDDPELVEKRRLSGPVNQGPANLAYVVNMLVGWAGPEMRLERLDFRFLDIVVPGDSVIASGTVTAVEPRGDGAASSSARGASTSRVERPPSRGRHGSSSPEAPDEESRLVLDPADVLPNLLARRATETPERVYARHVDGSVWTYAGVERDVLAWAGRLAARGVGPGDRVVVMLPNSFASVAVWLAIARLGAIEVPVNTGYRGRFLDPPREQLRAPSSPSSMRNSSTGSSRYTRRCRVCVSCSSSRAAPSSHGSAAGAASGRTAITPVEPELVAPTAADVADDPLHLRHDGGLEGRSRRPGSRSPGPPTPARRSTVGTRRTSSTTRSRSST